MLCRIDRGRNPVEHSRFDYLLNKLQAVLADGALRATGLWRYLFRGSFHRRNRRLHAATLPSY